MILLVSFLIAVDIILSPVVLAYDVFQNSVITINPYKPFSSQVIKADATYVIITDIDLQGKTVNMPENSLLFIKNGVLKNGKLLGNYKIIAESKQVLDNVDVSEYNYPLKFKWLVGERVELYSKDFQGLPDVEVDFEGNHYIAKEAIILDRLRGFSFTNLTLESGFTIRYWNSMVSRGNCSPVGKKDDYTKIVTINSKLPKECEGYVIEIATADETKFDSRPNKDGIPTLYKGITSRISKVSGDTVYLTDSLEYFSKERAYNNHLVKSTYLVYKPRKFVLSNCSFKLSNRAGMSFNGCDFLIENCLFEALDGANCLLSLGGHSGRIRRCTIRGAYYKGTQTSYGIQINKGTKILIEESSFFNNRRSVDFSGSYESRYNEVRNCVFFQDKNEGKSGSALGGHSTSFGNHYRNNIIYGDYQIGIHCRGENEIIDNNRFECFATWMVGYGYNTTISNNLVIPVSGFATGVFAGSDIKQKGNKLTLTNNDIDVRAILVVGNSSIQYYLERNTIRFRPNTSTIKPIVFSELPSFYELKENIISCSREDVRVKLADGLELPNNIQVRVEL